MNETYDDPDAVMCCVVVSNLSDPRTRGLGAMGRTVDGCPVPVESGDNGAIQYSVQ